MEQNYSILHLHSMDSNPYSGLTVDSITPFQAYIDKAKEYGMKAIAFTEHGAVLHNVAKRQACEKAGIKYINAEEFYITEKIELGKLVRDNYHCCLYAKNYKGVLELNKLSSISFNREDGHFHYNPRITMEELEHTSDNILVLTACVGGILSKGTDEIKERFLNFIVKNKHRCWLEIQPHMFDLQVTYNQYLYELSTKYDLKLIATNDVHAINESHLLGRKKMQESKGICFSDEDECDLLFKDYDGIVAAFEKQNSLKKEIYLRAIDETNNFANLIDTYELNYSNKYPRLYQNSIKEFKDRINAGVIEKGINKLPNYKTDYLPRIKEEFDVYEHNDAIDLMLLDSDYKKWLLSNGMHYGVSRGSVSGSLIAYLIHCTDVDSVKYGLNFSRFMNAERISLADIDTDIYAEDRYKVREYLFEREGIYCCNIITFNTIQMRGAIKDIGRAYGMSVQQTQTLCDMVEQDENGRDCIPEEVRKKYPELFKYVDLVIGTVTSVGRHAAGIVCSPTDVNSDFGTLSITSDSRPVSQIDMHEIDSLNYVKLDLLGLNAVGLIDKTCRLANIDFLTPSTVNFADQNVIDSIAQDTTLIFQFESGFASELLKKTLSDESIANMKQQSEDIPYLDIMAMVNGAIRPAGESYRDDISKGIYKDNGNKALNDFLKPTLGYLIYQEQIIDFLHNFCGYTMGQADIVRRHFAKKIGTEKDIPIIENGGYMTDIKGEKDTRYIKGFISTVKEKYGMEEEEARQAIKYFLKVIEDASSYIFSKNHSIPYSMISFFIGWLRYYYKIELLTAALNIYKNDDKKMQNIKKYIKSQGIEIRNIKFGKSKAEYFMDRESNAIYQGIESIKYCNATIADDLYDMSHKKKYISFVELLVDINKKSIMNSRQLDILIRLDFFSDFGDVKYLLKCVEFFSFFYDKKSINKNKLANMGLKEESVREYALKETNTRVEEIDHIAFINSRGLSENDLADCVKRNGKYSTKLIIKKFSVTETEVFKYSTHTIHGVFSDIDHIGLLNHLCSHIKVQPMRLHEKISNQLEYLGDINIVDKKYNGRCVVTDLMVEGTPKVILYALANGNSIPCKIDKKTFSSHPLNRGDIIEVVNQYKKPKVKPLKDMDGRVIKWVEQEETEWWITEYRKEEL